MKDAQFRALISTTDVKARYGYCLKRIADSESLCWLESQHGRCILGPDEHGHSILPIWPHPRFAEHYLANDPVAKDAWAGSKPAEIDVHEFLEEDLPDLLANNYQIAAFPLPPGQAAVVSASDFQAHLQYELSQIE